MGKRCALGDGEVRAGDASPVPLAKRPLSAHLPPGTTREVYNAIKLEEDAGRGDDLVLHARCRFKLYPAAAKTSSAAAASAAAPALPPPLQPDQPARKHPMGVSPETEGKKPGHPHRTGFPPGFLLHPREVHWQLPWPAAAAYIR